MLGTLIHSHRQGRRKVNTQQPVVQRLLRSTLLLTWAALAPMRWAAAQEEISSFASVQDDGSLRMAGSVVQLYGIYIPPTSQSCYTFVRPVACASRAALALDFKISGQFIHCRPKATNPDGSLTASCSAENEDLGAWMLQQGWALARPDAPFEYAALEKIARSKGIGIWGIPVERVPPKP